MYFQVEPKEPWQHTSQVRKKKDTQKSTVHVGLLSFCDISVSLCVNVSISATSPSPTSPRSPSWPMFSAPSSPQPISSASSDSSPVRLVDAVSGGIQLVTVTLRKAIGEGSGPRKVWAVNVRWKEMSGKLKWYIQKSTISSISRGVLIQVNSKVNLLKRLFQNPQCQMSQLLPIYSWRTAKKKPFFCPKCPSAIFFHPRSLKESSWGGCDLWSSPWKEGV